jgi:hypothetical protein
MNAWTMWDFTAKEENPLKVYDITVNILSSNVNKQYIDLNNDFASKRTYICRAAVKLASFAPKMYILVPILN